MELTDLSLGELSWLLRQGQTSSQEIVRAFLERIAKLDERIHAFLYLDAEGALRRAIEADKQLQAWRRQVSSSSESEIAALPLLLGLPVAIKDVLTVAGMPCTAGSRILEGFVPPFNATAVEKLIAAGAIILGKTNTDEFAMGSSTENSAYGCTRNPWDTERVPGGSSGGSAAAVAARLVPAALGTDTGGSVRLPASYCGVTGLKPTYGRISRYGLIAYGSSLDTVGAFGSEVRDVAILFGVMAGRDRRDSTSLDVPHTSYDFHTAMSIDLSKLRIGVPKEFFITGIQAEVEEAVKRAIGQLEAAGAEVKTISLPHTEYALPVYYIIAPAEASANLARFDGVRYGPRLGGADGSTSQMWDVFYQTRGECFGAEVKRRIMLGTYALSAGYYDAYYGQAQKVRTLIKRDFERVFDPASAEAVDVIAAPVAPTTAFRIGEHSEDPLAMYLEDIFTLTANLAGVPALSLPVGFDRQGLPIGMQLIGPHFGEDTLFRTAFAFQQVTDWHKRMPALDVARSDRK